MCSTTICSTEPISAKLDGPVSKIGGSIFFKISYESSETTTANPDHWITPLVRYLGNPDHITGRKVRRHALKYVMLDTNLYRQTIDSLLLKCLGSDQSKIAMGKVYEDIYGTHQSTYKIKWLLHRVGFYWPTMINDCFRYYKGCESYQKFKDVQLAPTAMLHPIIKSWLFHDWDLDFVGQIHSASFKDHRFVFVATYYFTKWT
jgi:hypothetical protein